jgi:hypothetical protein
LETRAEEYRRLAAECLRLVASVATEEARAALVEMARVWGRLADAAAEPAIQQQQQQIQSSSKDRGGEGE